MFSWLPTSLDGGTAASEIRVTTVDDDGRGFTGFVAYLIIPTWTIAGLVTRAITRLIAGLVTRLIARWITRAIVRLVHHDRQLDTVIRRVRVGRGGICDTDPGLRNTFGFTHDPQRY